MTNLIKENEFRTKLKTMNFELLTADSYPITLISESYNDKIRIIFHHDKLASAMNFDHKVSYNRTGDKHTQTITVGYSSSDDLLIDFNNSKSNFNDEDFNIISTAIKLF